MFRLHLRCWVLVEGHAVVDFETVAATDDFVEQPRAYRRLIQPRCHVFDAQFWQPCRDTQVMHRLGPGQSRQDNLFAFKLGRTEQRRDQVADPRLRATLSYQ
ncbi:hypothetical protein D9M69_539650 [compost metagenome]